MRHPPSATKKELELPAAIGLYASSRRRSSPARCATHESVPFGRLTALMWPRRAARARSALSISVSVIGSRWSPVHVDAKRIMLRTSSQHSTKTMTSRGSCSSVPTRSQRICVRKTERTAGLSLHTSASITAPQVSAVAPAVSVTATVPFIVAASATVARVTLGSVASVTVATPVGVAAIW